MNNLPPTNEFPEDIVSEVIEIKDPPKLQHGNYRMIGRNIICTLCPNQHTIPLSDKSFTVIDGKIEKIVK